MLFHPSYLTLSKVEVPSPLKISEMWSSLQVLCMAVCYAKLNRPSNSREISSLLGGADTTVSAEYAFFLAMVLYPGSYFILLKKLTIWSFFLQTFRKRRTRNWILSSVKGDYLDFQTNPIYHTSMPSLQKFFDGIVLLPQALPSSLLPLSDDFLTQSCRRSTYGFGRWFHWRLLYS